MYVSSPAGQTKGQKGNVQTVGAGTGFLGRLLGMLPGGVGMG